MYERRPLPSELTPEEQRLRAAQFRQMAAAARTADTQGALLRLALKYEELAATQDAQAGGETCVKTIK
jgi:hypothetical protein